MYTYIHTNIRIYKSLLTLIYFYELLIVIYKISQTKKNNIGNLDEFFFNSITFAVQCLDFFLKCRYI